MIFRAFNSFCIDTGREAHRDAGEDPSFNSFCIDTINVKTHLLTPTTNFQFILH